MKLLNAKDNAIWQRHQPALKEPLQEQGKAPTDKKKREREKGMASLDEGSEIMNKNEHKIVSNKDANGDLSKEHVRIFYFIIFGTTTKS